MAKARRKVAAKRKPVRKVAGKRPAARRHGKVGRPVGYKCSKATRDLMSKARRAWWKSHKRGGKKRGAKRGRRYLSRDFRR